MLCSFIEVSTNLIYFWHVIKKEIKQADYILVGQGLAGSTLALRLINHGKKIVVFDDPNQNKSSTIAAGLFNPITGNYLKKTWLADKIFEELFSFYPAIEKQLNTRFFYPSPIYRPFISIAEQNEWMAISGEPGVKNYINRIVLGSLGNLQVKDPFGGIVLSACGFLNTNGFMLAVRKFLIEQESYRCEWFDDGELFSNPEKVVYKDIEAQKIIFCTGTHCNESALLRAVPVRKLKGETITINLNETPELIYNRGVYIVPLNNEFKVGATYEFKQLTEVITQEGRNELEIKLAELINMSYQVINQEWGFRPTTPDRRPILGKWNTTNNILIFNGLGTKGVSLAPYFSKCMVDDLLFGHEIQKEVNINRFKALSSKSSGVV